MFGFLRKKKKRPLFLEQYESLFLHKTPGNTPLDKLRFVIMDTETTGTDPAKASLLSFGGIAITNMSLDLADSLEIVFQDQPVALGKTADIHGILKSHLRAGTSPQQALPRILAFLKNAVLVGHHIDFDKKMLDNALQHNFRGAKVRNKVVDTATLALRLEHFNDSYVYRPTDYSLDALCHRYHIAVTDRHTAAGDAFITGQLFLKLLGKCRERKINLLRDLLKNPGFQGA